MSDILQRSGIAFGVALALALADWLAVARKWRRLEWVFKPATLAAVLVAGWLLTGAPHDHWLARFFLAGLALSLVGDVLLLLPGQRFFLLGLTAFLLAHLCYLAGLNPTPPPRPSPMLLVLVAGIGLALYRPIAAGLRSRGQTALLPPVAIYSVAISLMLFSAWATLFRPEWAPLRQALVIGGASLFFASDAMLAWNRFVAPFRAAELGVIVTYHLGQIALTASIAQTRDPASRFDIIAETMLQ